LQPSESIGEEGERANRGFRIAVVMSEVITVASPRATDAARRIPRSLGLCRMSMSSADNKMDQNDTVLSASMAK